MKKIRLLITDDHALMRVGLKTMLKIQKDMTVVGEAASGEEAVRLAAELKPDVIVMDLMMTVINGVEAARRIRVSVPETRIVILTSYGTSDELRTAFAEGIAGIQLKGCRVERDAPAGYVRPLIEPYMQFSRIRLTVWNI